ncbi:MAG: phosphoglucomutase/phosphomannomutase family protein [Candidatus Saganbacteria bacterium]|nr:phosphoglucomutase/phosphomannomutase family protein [Candidatus Saganbacteria bacterium]
MIKFGTDGWRAVISEEFTFANVRKVAQAIAEYLKNHKLVNKELIIGYDPRFLADKFAEEVAKVMLVNGISCAISDRDIPTPVVAFEVKDRSASGAVMITASHNPPQYCGIKFIPEYAGPAGEEITSEIESYIKKGTEPEVSARKGSVQRFDPRKRYFKSLELLVDKEIIKKAKLKIVCDPMYGAGRDYLDNILQDFGCMTEEIHGYRDVLFGGGSPEPNEETLRELQDMVKEGRFDLGLALDGDADRFGVVDEKSNFLSANQVFALVFKYLVDSRGFTGEVARSVATTHMIDRIAESYDIKVNETPVGFKHIAKLMMTKDIIIGGEESGGLSIKGHVPEKDGILACLLVAEMVARLKKPLSEIYSELSKEVGPCVDKKISLRMEEEKKKKFMEILLKTPPEKIAGIKVEERNLMDGVKFILMDGSWLLARPSGTEPLIRVYFESSSAERIGKMQEDLSEIIARL